MLYWLSVGCLLLVPCCLGASLPSSSSSLNDDLLHSLVLEDNHGFIMKWTPRTDDIIIQLEARTEGWVGIGFSRFEGMAGADMIMAWVDDVGMLHFTDRYATADAKPLIDTSQDYHVIGGYRNDSYTVVRFSRAWDTCDEQHDLIIGDDTVQVLWAYGNDRIRGQEDTTSYHRSRGHRNIYLREPSVFQAPTGRDVNTWSVRSGGVSLPSNHDTLYWCKIVERPGNLVDKNHMIAYEPRIELANKAYVHHMILYECHFNGRSSAYLQRFLKIGGAQCYSSNMPNSWFNCGSPIIAWAVGSEGELYPEHAGFPLGEAYGGADYFMLEIHYDNPFMRNGIRDNSGLDIYYTDRVRRYDAGTMWYGHTVSPEHVIPPRQIWKTQAYCTESCTREALPRDGIKIFSGVLHQHLIGEAITVRQYRNGRELPVLFQDNNYDFNYQQARVVEKNKEKIVLPGDTIKVICTTNSTHRNQPTFGGFRTSDEMCLVFVNYYPKIPLTACTSSPRIGDIMDALQISIPNQSFQRIKNGLQDMFARAVGSVDEAKENDLLNELQSVSENGGENTESVILADFLRRIVAGSDGSTLHDVFFNSSIWTQENINRLRTMLMSADIQSGCYDKRGNSLVKGNSLLSIPNFEKLDEPPSKCTSNSPTGPTSTFGGFGGFTFPFFYYPPQHHHVDPPGNNYYYPGFPTIGNGINNGPISQEQITAMINRILYQLY